MTYKRLVSLVLISGLGLSGACASEPDPIPADEVANIASAVYATDQGGEIESTNDIATLSVEYYNDIDLEEQGSYSQTIDLPSFKLLYALDYDIDSSAGSVEWDGSIESEVDTNRIKGSLQRKTSYKVTNIDGDDPLTFNGSIETTFNGETNFPTLNISSTVESEWEQQWDDIEFPKDCSNTCFPTGEVELSGSIETTYDGSGADSEGEWSGVITVTFDGDRNVTLSVDSDTDFTLDLVNGSVTIQ